MTSWLWWPTTSCDILTRHVKNLSVNERHYCDAVAFLVGKMSWFWVQGWTFVWRCWSDLSFLGFKSCSTPLDALDSWPIGFLLSKKKNFFHVCGTRLVHLLIRGPSTEKSGLIIEQHKIWKIFFLNVSLTLSRGWGQTDMNATQAQCPYVRTQGTHLIARRPSASPTTWEAQGAQMIGARWFSTGWWRHWCFSFLFFLFAVKIFGLKHSYCAVLC